MRSSCGPYSSLIGAGKQQGCGVVRKGNPPLAWGESLTLVSSEDYSEHSSFSSKILAKGGKTEMADLAGTILGEIVALRKAAVAEARARRPVEELERAAEARHEWRDFAAALSAGGIQIIAELKQASPSRGVIRPHYRVREIAQGYEAGGAAALSVLTEERYFQGSLTDLIDARDATGLPVLRKDFIVDAYQVYESVAAGADALLLIVAALGDKELRTLIELCSRLGIAALVEIHTGEELEQALGAGAKIVGVNNRNLKTLEVNLEASFRLRSGIPDSLLAVSESGIKTVDDLRRLAMAGFNAALIGETFMLAEDPGHALANLLESARPNGASHR